jgi:glycosyltransferase involved in cell wall biosynthesis
LDTTPFYSTSDFSSVNTDTSFCDVPSVLFLRPRSVSLDVQSHLAQLRTATVIEWWRRRLVRRPDSRVYIVVQTEREHKELTSLCLQDTTVVRLPYSSQTRALYALTSLEKIEHLILLTLASALLPLEDLNKLLAIHMEGNNAISWCSGITSGLGPCFLSHEILKLLAKPEFSAMDSHPVPRFRNIRHKAPIKHHVFNLATRYRLTTSEMPVKINFDQQESIEIAREVLHPNDDPNEVEGVRLWKKILIQRKDTFINQNISGPRSYSTYVNYKRPRILFTSNASAFSGAEESLCQLVQKIDRSRYEVFAAVGLPSRLQRRLEESGARVTAFTDGLREPTMHRFKQIKDLISSIQPDIIHSNAIDGIPLLWNAFDNRIPFIQHVRNGDMKNYGEYVESANVIIAVSGYLRDRIMRFAIKPDRVHVIYDEVDTEYFDSVHCDREAARDKFGIPQEAKVIAMIARIAPNKRHDLMFKAFEQVLKSIPDAHLLLKGEDYRDDPYFDTVQMQIESCTGRQQIKHFKFVDDIRDIHIAADVLVLCSDREGLGRCVVEAMSMGVPVVVTDSGGTHEIVENGLTGTVVPGGDAIALAHAITATLKDDEFCRRASVHAREIAINKLSSIASSTAVMQIYDNLLGIKY